MDCIKGERQVVGIGFCVGDLVFLLCWDRLGSFYIIVHYYDFIQLTLCTSNYVYSCFSFQLDYYCGWLSEFYIYGWGILLLWLRRFCYWRWWMDKESTYMFMEIYLCSGVSDMEWRIKRMEWYNCGNKNLL